MAPVRNTPRTRGPVPAVSSSAHSALPVGIRVRPADSHGRPQELPRSNNAALPARSPPLRTEPIPAAVARQVSRAFGAAPGPRGTPPSAPPFQEDLRDLDANGDPVSPPPEPRRRPAPDAPLR